MRNRNYKYGMWAGRLVFWIWISIILCFYLNGILELEFKNLFFVNSHYEFQFISLGQACVSSKSFILQTNLLSLILCSHLTAIILRIQFSEVFIFVIWKIIKEIKFKIMFFLSRFLDFWIFLVHLLQTYLLLIILSKNKNESLEMKKYLQESCSGSIKIEFNCGLRRRNEEFLKTKYLDYKSMNHKI